MEKTNLFSSIVPKKLDDSLYFGLSIPVQTFEILFKYDSNQYIYIHTISGQKLIHFVKIGNLLYHDKQVSYFSIIL